MSKKYYKNSVADGFKTIKTVFIFIMILVMIPVGLYQGIKYLVHCKLESACADCLKESMYTFEKVTYKRHVDESTAETGEDIAFIVKGLKSSSGKDYGTYEVVVNRELSGGSMSLKNIPYVRIDWDHIFRKLDKY